MTEAEANEVNARVMRILADTMEFSGHHSIVRIDSQFSDETLQKAMVLGGITMVPIKDDTVTNVLITINAQLKFKEAMGLFVLLHEMTK